MESKKKSDFPDDILSNISHYIPDKKFIVTVIIIVIII